MNPPKKDYGREILILLFLLIFVPAILIRINQNHIDQATINETQEISRTVQLLPLSADTLTLGTGPLAIGSRLELTLIIFDKSTPTVHQYWNLIVKEFLGTNGPVAANQTTDIKTIVLEVPVEYVLDIQTLIANPDLKKNITYRILTNADLSIPTPTATPTITSTPTPEGQGEVFLWIPVSEIAQLSSIDLGKGRLVIISGSQASGNNSTPIPYTATEFCVKVDAFQDSNGISSSVYKKETTQNIGVKLSINNLSQYGLAIEDMVHIYFVSDVNCKSGSN